MLVSEKHVRAADCSFHALLQNKVRAVTGGSEFTLNRAGQCCRLTLACRGCLLSLAALASRTEESTNLAHQACQPANLNLILILILIPNPNLNLIRSALKLQLDRVRELASTLVRTRHTTRRLLFSRSCVASCCCCCCCCRCCRRRCCCCPITSSSTFIPALGFRIA